MQLGDGVAKHGRLLAAPLKLSCRLHTAGAARPLPPTHLPPACPPPPLQGQLARRDSLLPDLLSFPPGTDLHDHPLVASGALVLQSKASCMPAHALAPRPGWAVVDGCAAPGNKTTHLAALMGNSGAVFAFEARRRRCRRRRCWGAGWAGGPGVEPAYALLGTG